MLHFNAPCFLNDGSDDCVRDTDFSSAVDPTEIEVLGWRKPRDFLRKSGVAPRTARCRQPPSDFARPAVDSIATQKTGKIKINLIRSIRVLYNKHIGFAEPFNRTSLESKHNQDGYTGINNVTFNRTSLESKLLRRCSSRQTLFSF